MSAGYKSKTFEPVQNAVKVGPDELGWSPDNIYRDHQITCLGLDGGTFAVKVLLPGEDGTDANLRTLETGKAQADIVKVTGLIVMRIVVEISNPGQNAAPKVTITSVIHGL